jgi:hypothetical protein
MPFFGGEGTARSTEGVEHATSEKLGAAGLRSETIACDVSQHEERTYSSLEHPKHLFRSGC